MRSSVITALLAATVSGASFANPQPSDRGIVESVREVRLASEPAAVPVFELAYQPPTGDELVVRLDDGRAITALSTGMQKFEPGQRVFVVPDRKGVRIEHADDAPSL